MKLLFFSPKVIKNEYWLCVIYADNNGSLLSEMEQLPYDRERQL